jgi:hypothetical protein
MKQQRLYNSVIIHEANTYIVCIDRLGRVQGSLRDYDSTENNRVYCRALSHRTALQCINHLDPGSAVSKSLYGQINFQNKRADLRLLAISSVAFMRVTLYDISGSPLGAFIPILSCGVFR